MKNKKKQYFLTTLVIVVVVAFSIIGYMRRQNVNDSSQLIADYHRPGGDTLSVAIEMSPLTYNISHDTIEGFDYLMLRDMARQHGVPVRFYPFTQLLGAFEDLCEGKYDMVVASMPATVTLKEHFPVTEQIYLDRQVLVQRRDEAIESPVALKGDTVWIASGKPFRTRLANMAAELGDTIIVLEDGEHSAEHLAIMTALGQIKHAVVGEAEARRVAERYPELDISTPVSLSQRQVWAVAPDDSVLVRRLDQWIADFKKTPQYANLVERYL